MHSVLDLKAIGLQFMRSTYLFESIHEALGNQFILAAFYKKYGYFDFGNSFGRVKAALRNDPH